jgi:hypothetical protein
VLPRSAGAHIPIFEAPRHGHGCLPVSWRRRR